MEPVIEYVTDVEGRWDKLATFVEGSPWVTLDAAGRLSVRDGAVLVFGGDAIDRGPDGRRVVRALLDLASRERDRVVLLAGNRDINKIRLTRELRGEPLARTPEAVRQGPRAELLKWIFDNTMGARQAFEHRRAELAREGRDAGDEAVAGSFLEDLGPGGELREYLRVCQLAWRAGSSLFVHGAVTDESLGVVPGVPDRLGVDAWVAGLNAWYRDQVEAWVEGRRDEAGEPAWEPLVAYQAPQPGTRQNQASVVYGRPSDDAANPYLPSPAVVRSLTDAGVHRVLVGHTPSGDAPAVLRDEGFELVLADNSYGRVERGSRVTLRGDALEVRGRTVLDDATATDVGYATTLAETSAPLGLRDAASGELVKARLATGDYLLFLGLPGNQVTQRAVSPRALAARALVPPRR